MLRNSHKDYTRAKSKCSFAHLSSYHHHVLDLYCPRWRSWPDLVWSFTSFSTCFFDVFFGLPLLPLNSNFKAFTVTFSSFLKTWQYHRILLALAILSKDSFMPNMSINSSLFLRSNSFTPHIARIIALFFLLKTAISFSLKHHASLPCNIADLTQLLKTYFFIFNENLLPSSILLHSMNFIQSILDLAVTTLLHPPVAFNWSPK